MVDYIFHVSTRSVVLFVLVALPWLYGAFFSDMSWVAYATSCCFDRSYNLQPCFVSEVKCLTKIS